MRSRPVCNAGRRSGGATPAPLHHAGDSVDRRGLAGGNRRRHPGPHRGWSPPVSSDGRGVFPVHDLWWRIGQGLALRRFRQRHESSLRCLSSQPPDAGPGHVVVIRDIDNRGYLRRDRRRVDPLWLLAPGPDGGCPRFVDSGPDQASRSRRPGGLSAGPLARHDDPARGHRGPSTGRHRLHAGDVHRGPEAGGRRDADARVADDRSILSPFVRLPHEGIRIRAAARDALSGDRLRARD